MIECLQLALAKICLWSAALLLSVLVGWKSLRCLAWMLPLIERKPVRVVVFGVVVSLGGLCVCISYGGSKTNAPPCGAANPPRLMAGPGAPIGGDDASSGDGMNAAGLPGLQITGFTLETNGVTIGSCWNPDLWLTGLGLFHSPFVNSNDWEMLDHWGVSRDTTNDVHAVPFGGAFTNSVAGFFRLYGYPDPERELYTTIGLTLLDPNAYNEVTITGEGGFASESGTLWLEYGVTNEVLIRIGQRYTINPWWNDTFALSSEDPFVSCAEAEYEMSLSVCRPVRVVLTDRPPPEDAARCPLGHVHARYCDFATDPALPGELAFYDTACIAVDNSNRTLSVATSWAPGHRSAYRLMEDYGALGTFTETNGTVDLVFDDLCPHSVGSGAYCFCGQIYYCPDCIGSTAAWHNLMFPGLLTATNAPDGSVSLDWHDGVASNAYYFVELATTNASQRFSISPRLPTMTRDYQVQTVPGLTARIPLLAGVSYTVSTDYGDFTVAATDPDVVVTQASNRAFAVSRPLGFDVEEMSGAGTNCVEGHVHARHYRITTSIPDISGTIEFDDTKCFTPTGPNEFVAECDGHRGATCPTNDVITGRFIYEGVTKLFAITNAALCRCDNRHHPTCPCGAGSLCNECDTTIYGQDEHWVRANFDRLRGLDPDLDDADDILRYGYASWVDRRVGYGRENGLYMLTATFDEAPPVPTRLSVGDYVVSVTNSGIYAFLLEKGVDYYFDTYPRVDGVIYSARDDLASPPMTTALESELVGQPGVWTRDGGEKELTSPDGNNPGHSLQMPSLTATPDVAYLGPDDLPITFSAVLSDYYRTDDVAYHWTSSDPRFEIESPNGVTTRVNAVELPGWASGSFLVSAGIGPRTLQASLGVGWGTDGHPLVGISIQPDHVWVNQPASEDNKRTVVIRFVSDIPTNGTVDVSFIGDGSRLGLTHTSRTWSVHPMVHMSRDNPLEFEFGVAEGIAPSVSVEGEKFECRFTGSAGTLVWTNAITVAKVASVELWSERGGDLARYLPPFPGQAENPFDRTHSPYLDYHYPILFSNVVDSGLHVLPFDVEYRVRTLPLGFEVFGGRTMLSRVEAPQSGTTIDCVGKTAVFRNPNVGGVYRINVAYEYSPPTGTTLVLPPSGADIESVVMADFARADAFCSYVTNHFSYFEINSRKRGRSWFYENGMGDYRGRSDSQLMPVVWAYNQVNDNSGMGGCVTWRNVPVRVAKLSNVLVAYACEKIGVCSFGQQWSQSLGTGNDQSATLAWEVGVRIAREGNVASNITDFVQRAWTMDDEKPRRLWPNSNPVETYVPLAPDDFDELNYDYQFYSPNFMDHRFYIEDKINENN